MDNQFDNNYGFEPQRPITEKQPEPPTREVKTDRLGFEPRKPLMDNPALEIDSREHAFNPIRHTAVYSDNRFESQPQQQQAPSGYRPAPPVYASPVTPEPVREDTAAEKSDNNKGGSKVNTALVVVIIVLGVLLMASMLGLFGYVLFKSDDGRGSDKYKSDPSHEVFVTSTPYSGEFFFPDTPSTEKPEKVHEETDFSDKTDESYAGLALAEKPADAQTNAAYNAEYAFNSASGAVVSVLCYRDEVGDNNSADSEGSGIVISSDGYVITNSHVVGNSKTAYAIKVVTADGKDYTAGVVGYDSRTDIAVLKLVDAENLKAAAFGNSEKLTLGEDIIVIGNPGGIEYQNSMTKGIVSAINRDASSKNIVKYIQTDAAINPGNSGGPAVNVYGQVIGIASAKIADEKYEGMGFCIPSAQTKEIVDNLIKNGFVDGRVKIGISGNAVTASQAEVYDLPRGIVVYTIQEDGPCGGTELKPEDIITEFDGKKIATFSDIYEALEEHKAGDKVKLKFYRYKEVKEYEIEITLQADKS